VEVGLPMIVRGTDRHGMRFEDATHCFNVSRTGASFATTRDFELGADVEVLITLASGGRGGLGDFSTLARVVRIVPGEDPAEKVVGVQFLEARFPRVFSSESTT
jgi:hypothetical protein